MSIRTALVAAMLLVITAVTAILCVLGVMSVNRSVIREAQARVDHDLRVVGTHYQRLIDSLGRRFENRVQGVEPGLENAMRTVRRLRDELDFTILNLCDAKGKPVAGGYPRESLKVPIGEDMIIRRALEGNPTWGTVILDPRRLRTEGGAALEEAMRVPARGTERGTACAAAMFWWFAAPVRDESDRITGVLYGGRALNFRYELVDELRDLVLGADLYDGKPMGTVTLFLGGVRVSTNVLGPDGRRAVGTRVSDEVRERVLKEGEPWRDRAWVVDSWYLSGYDPIRDPEGGIIGMLYVGLLEAPYTAMRARLLVRFLLPVVFVGVGAIALALFIVGRVTRPLSQLGEAAERMAKGDRDHTPEVARTYAEINQLAENFRRMQRAIAERDDRLNAQYRQLAEANEQLQRANRNYMETLGFVTHELKSPLAAMQSMIDLLVSGTLGELPEKAQRPLVRIKRNCEELQDMVKNYLDLSRAERGELEAEKRPIDFVKEVVEPCLAQAQPLFASRNMRVETAHPDTLMVEADAELMRIALANYLSNAAKYGREGGRAKLEADVEGDDVIVSVWNEGAGFTDEDRDRLFKKFSRLRTKETRDKRGSGLGLFLSKEVLRLHGGEVRAESAPGEWARFSFRFPQSPAAGR